jgi:hypothetical protein
MKKDTTIRIITLLVGLFGLSSGPVRAESVKIADLDGLISVINTPGLGPTQTIGARLGLWDGSNFTSVGNATGAGFFDNELKELQATFSAAANPTGYPNGTLLALAIYGASASLDYSSTFNRAVLIDSNWLMPTINFGTAVKANYQLTASTTAVIGEYSFNGGNQVITLVPEPATGSLLLLGGVWVVAMRRLRKP